MVNRERTGTLRKKWFLLPVVFNMGILPLIMRMYVFDTHLSGFSWYGTTEQGTDLFNYYKHTFFLCTSGIMLLILLWKLTEEKGWKALEDQRAFLPLTAYGIMVLLSAAFSEYGWFTAHGMIDHFETVFVLLGYCITAAYSFYFVRDETDVRFLLGGWGLCLIPMMLLGLSQISGHDFYASELGKRLYMTPEARAAGREITLTFGKGRVYLSLLNPNYVGVFCMLAFPVLLVMGIWENQKRKRIFYLILAAGILACIIGAVAKTAFIVMPIALVFLLLLLRKDVAARKKTFLAAAAGLIVIVIGTDLFYGGLFFDKLRNSLITTGGHSEEDLQEVATEGENIRILYKGETLYIHSVVNKQGMMGFVVKDGSGQLLPGQAVGDQESGIRIEIDDARFTGISLSPLEVNHIPSFSVEIEENHWIFSNYTGSEGCYFYSPYGKFMKIGTAPSIGFKGHERIFTNRGYIWSRTLPLLKDHLFLGSGPDTFLLEFPQYDFLNKSRYLGNELVSKPHNIYLQIAVQTGCVSALCFLMFYMLYFIESIRLYWKHGSDSGLSRTGAALCAATAGYMVIGMTTDSTITVAPLFWSMMGIGLAVNKIIRQKA